MFRHLEKMIWFIAVGLAVYIFLPTSIWFEPKKIEIIPLSDGNFEVIFVRDIDYDFKGSYTVTVRNTKDEILLQETSGVFKYLKDSTLPDKITMDWWAPTIAGRVKDLPSGYYYVETCWDIQLPIANKHTCLTSNIVEKEESAD